MALEAAGGTTVCAKRSKYHILKCRIQYLQCLGSSEVVLLQDTRNVGIDELPLQKQSSFINFFVATE